MTDDDLDRILSKEETIAPSARFVASVMVAVRRENTTPAPLLFPWKRALPGIAAAIVSIVLLCAAISSSLAEPRTSWHAGIMFSGWNGATAAWTAVREAMSVDKKARGARLRLVVLDGLARPEILDNPSEELLAQAYREVSK